MVHFQYAAPELATRALLDIEQQLSDAEVARTIAAAAAPTRVPPISDDPMRLAPMFARCVLSVMEGMIDRGFDPHIYEAERSDELQKYYYAQGRTRPGAIITNASSSLRSFHGYRLAVDIISRSKGWAAPMAFWNALGEESEKVGLFWGGRWPNLRDYPHVQWASGASSVHVPTTPSETMERIWKERGVMALWGSLGAV